MKSIPNSASFNKCKNCQVRCHSAFDLLSANDLNEIEKIRSMVKFEADEQLPKMDGDDLGFYCLQSGFVKVHTLENKREEIVQLCGPGDLVGYWGNQFIKNIAITSLEVGMACFFSYKNFLPFQDSSPNVSNGIVKMLTNALLAQNQQITNLENLTVKNRVASSLLMLEQKFGIPSSQGKKINLKLDRKILATISGTSKESLARTLTELEKDGYILREGRSIHIREVEKLKKLANG